MRPIGFSTGSLALGDFRRALQMLEGTAAEAVELSALRTPELPVLVAAAGSLSLEQFRHVSVHAPSKFSATEEGSVVDLLWQLVDRGWPIVIHPDTIHAYPAWREFRSWLWVENMDKRKPIGRSSSELERIFDELPEAGLCFDIAHARQFDPSMVEAYRILRRHQPRLRQVHLSEVSSTSKHTCLSYGAIHDFIEVAQWIPPHLPVILESPASAEDIEIEMQRARESLPESGAVPV